MKDMIVLIARIFISLVGLICLAICIARPDENQALLTVGTTLNLIAFLLSLVSRKKDK